ncbi:TetR family transcriptional regulator [Actinotalea sp. M2MS4P-6]|uniref:TetR/AcrR family transcriptional regulator n=1 Tax=Actinotalea sp. M2MS4P-6 TaxID=2983762 RepID=UPI0021E46E3D|nr:TetR family transcriptional regulator [Actinotalea sp. M2MS4P-6]MCV2395199.1 TetR family transcriptional regulator [Actinotalea sp. M2MS4P-6]
MPKIDAPTVVEHHARRRAALLHAAAEIVADGGLDALTLAAAGRATGLARSSVYQYFDSTPALIAAMVEDLMPRSGHELAVVTARAGDPRAQVEAFVAAALRTATDPTHRALAALGTASLPPECAARVAELHRDQEAPLRAALAELPVPDPELTAALLLGTVQGAVRAVESGRSLDEVTRRTLAVVRAVLGD